jgi:hypothetical protein
MDEFKLKFECDLALKRVLDHVDIYAKEAIIKIEAARQKNILSAAKYQWIKDGFLPREEYTLPNWFRIYVQRASELPYVIYTRNCYTDCY